MREDLLLIKDKNKIAVKNEGNQEYSLPSLLIVNEQSDIEYEKIIFDKYRLRVTGIKRIEVKEGIVLTECHILHDIDEIENDISWMNIKKVVKTLFLNIKNRESFQEYFSKQITTNNIKLQYGLKNNSIIHISEIPVQDRGEKCGCVCPLCQEKLQARIGNGKRRPHFSHSKEGCNIESAQQTALHLLAKEMLTTSSYINLPSLIVNVTNDNFIDKDLSYDAQEEQIAPLIYNPSIAYQYNHVMLEKKLDNIIPDVLIWTEGHQKKLIIEIAVTHFIDEEKRRKILDNNFPCVEINLSHYYNKSFNRKQLKEEIIDNVDSKEWIYNSHCEKAQEALNNRNKNIAKKYREIEEENRKKLALIQAEKIQDSYRKENSRREKIKRIESVLKDDNYAQRINYLQNNTEVLRNLKAKKFYNEAQGNLPFYLDIPITGQVAFNCDRRVWQMDIFDMFIYNRRSNTEISIIRIWNWLTKYAKKDYLDWDFIIRYNFNLGSMHYKENLAINALKTYLTYLSRMGFILEGHGFKYREDHLINAGTIHPPNKEYAELLEIVVNSVEDRSLVDSDISELLKYLTK